MPLFINVDLLRHRYENSANYKNMVAVMALLVVSVFVSVGEFWSHLRLIRKWNNNQIGGGVVQGHGARNNNLNRVGPARAISVGIPLNVDGELNR